MQKDLPPRPSPEKRPPPGGFVQTGLLECGLLWRTQGEYGYRYAVAKLYRDDLESLGAGDGVEI